jgi:Mitochondrial genome maintenance MGM101
MRATVGRLLSRLSHSRPVYFPKQHLPTLAIQSRQFFPSFTLRQATHEPLNQVEAEEVAVAPTSLNDAPVFFDDDTTQVDWSRSFHGLSTQPFSEEATKILTAPIDPNDVEIKPGHSL